MTSGVATQGSRKTREQQAADQARELLVFADGIEDAGHPELARRSRVVARDTIWLVEQLEAERAARIRMTEDRDRWRDNRWRAEHGQAFP